MKKQEGHQDCSGLCEAAVPLPHFLSSCPTAPSSQQCLSSCCSAHSHMLLLPAQAAYLKFTLCGVLRKVLGCTQSACCSVLG